jgi:hypothetical protein
LFSWYFWSSTFFLPKYTPKYDFRTIVNVCPLCKTELGV